MNVEQVQGNIPVTDRLLRTREVAELVGFKEQTLHQWRSEGRSPLPYVRIGRAIRYRETDVAAFVSNPQPTAA